jgi:hypothetical protein
VQLIVTIKTSLIWHRSIWKLSLFFGGNSRCICCAHFVQSSFVKRSGCFFCFSIGGGKILTHEIQKEITHVMKVGEFLADETLVASDDNSVYTLQNDRINVRSFQVGQQLSMISCKHKTVYND